MLSSETHPQQTCFLFNDLILWCKPKKDKFVVRHELFLKHVTPKMTLEGALPCLCECPRF